MGTGRELIKNLLADVKKTGYPSEIIAGNVMQDYGWEVDYNKYYLDWDEKKGREIDLIAWNKVYSKKHEVYVQLYLIAEVKKSEGKHWIIFSTEGMGLEEPGWGRIHQAYDEITSDVLPGDIMDEKSSISGFERFGRSYYQAFSGQGSKDTIFEALSSSVKASEDYLRHTELMDKEEEERLGRSVKVGRDITFIEPIVILDGLLFETYLKQSNKFIMKEIRHIPVCFGYLSPEYKRYESYGEYLVEVVTLEGLPNLLLKKMKWLNHIKQTIIKNITKQS